VGTLVYMIAFNSALLGSVFPLYSYYFLKFDFNKLLATWGLRAGGVRYVISR